MTRNQSYCTSAERAPTTQTADSSLEHIEHLEPWRKQWWYGPRIRAGICFVAISVAAVVYASMAIEDGEAGIFGFLALGFLVIIPLERLIPRNQYRVLRPQWFTDLLHILFTGLLSFAPLFLLFPYLEHLRWETGVAFVQSLPGWMQIVLAFAVREFLIYWGHRLSHTIPLLWRFHAVHHSSAQLDWLAGERRHPIDGLYIATFTILPMAFFGFDLIDLLILGVFNDLWDMTIHANLRWRLKWLDGIWVTTQFHHWHHARDLTVRDKNFAGALPVYDWLFGTFYLPQDQDPGPYGIDTHMPDSYFGQLVQPFLPVTAAPENKATSVAPERPGT